MIFRPKELPVAIFAIHFHDFACCVSLIGKHSLRSIYRKKMSLKFDPWIAVWQRVHACMYVALFGAGPFITGNPVPAVGPKWAAVWHCRQSRLTSLYFSM